MDYDAIAHRYDRRYERTDYGGIEAVLMDFAGEDRTRRILEVGCGTGHWLGRFADHGFVHLAGLDPSSQMLAVAAARVAQADLRRASAESLPWPDDTFDRVCCVNALHHFDDPPRFVAEARRVLPPGGGLVTVGLDPYAGTDRWAVYDHFDGTLDADRQRYPRPPGSARGCVPRASSTSAPSRPSTSRRPGLRWRRSPPAISTRRPRRSSRCCPTPPTGRASPV